MLQNIPIEGKPFVRHLGIYIHDNLKWHSRIAHVESVVGKYKFSDYGKSKIYFVITRMTSL